VPARIDQNLGSVGHPAPMNANGGPVNQDGTAAVQRWDDVTACRWTAAGR
jgi:hypothetical protein